MASLDFDSFRRSVQENKIPPSLPACLQSLWFDAKGDWDQAHHLVDKNNDRISARVHAYLHRKEGDQWNADYWYRQAGTQRPQLTLDQEWESLVRQLLSESNKQSPS